MGTRRRGAGEGSALRQEAALRLRSREAQRGDPQPHPTLFL